MSIAVSRGIEDEDEWDGTSRMARDAWKNEEGSRCEHETYLPENIIDNCCARAEWRHVDETWKSRMRKRGERRKSVQAMLAR